VLLANQVATGLALTLFGLGLSSLIGQGYVGIKPPPTPRLDFGPLTDIPALGTILFHHDPMVYLSILIIAAVWALLAKAPARHWPGRCLSAVWCLFPWR
jgi:simple sugar transport system permease protein